MQPCGWVVPHLADAAGIRCIIIFSCMSRLVFICVSILVMLSGVTMRVAGALPMVAAPAQPSQICNRRKRMAIGEVCGGGRSSNDCSKVVAWLLDLKQTGVDDRSHQRKHPHHQRHHDGATLRAAMRKPAWVRGWVERRLDCGG